MRGLTCVAGARDVGVGSAKAPAPAPDAPKRGGPIRPGGRSGWATDARAFANPARGWYTEPHSRSSGTRVKGTKRRNAMSFSEDPTHGAIPGDDPTRGMAEPAVSADPTQGAEVGATASEDPTAGPQGSGNPYDDPTQGDEVGELPGEDPTE
jgi:hypothetical protein